MADEPRVTEDGEERVTESSETRILEDGVVTGQACIWWKVPGG